MKAEDGLVSVVFPDREISPDRRVDGREITRIEIGTAALLLLDRVPRLAAVLVIPVMLVAIGTAGPSWQNLGVLMAALGLLVIETIPGGQFGSKPTR